LKNLELYIKNGIIRDFFQKETEHRIRQEWSEREEKDILRNMLTDTDTAVAYVRRVNEIKSEVKAEIETALGFSVDVGFDPDAESESLPQRVDELNEALTMILEGVTD
jgi:2-phospho-L-lactate guanylyltransferase (CobY/MobA/RfbA family)